MGLDALALSLPFDQYHSLTRHPPPALYSKLVLFVTPPASAWLSNPNAYFLKRTGYSI